MAFFFPQTHLFQLSTHAAIALVSTILSSAFLLQNVAQSHEAWLEPEPLFPAPGQEVVVPLKVGERLRAEEQKSFQREAIARFQVFTAGARKRPLDLLATGREGQNPISRFKAEAGGGLVVLDRPPRRLTLDAEKFNRYLVEEGFSAVQAQRAQLGQTGQPGRERYSRFLKALVQDKEPSAAPGVLYRRRVGQRLEILLLNDPAKLRMGQRLGVKVVFENRPLAGARIEALHRDRDNADARILTATTDARGRATFAVDAPGFWLLSLVHMRSVPPTDRRDGDDSQWESFWASFAIGIRQLPVSAGGVPPSKAADRVTPTPEPASAGTPPARRQE